MGLTFHLVLVKLALNPYIFVLIIWRCMVLSLHLQRRLGQAVIDILNIRTLARSKRTHSLKSLLIFLLQATNDDIAYIVIMKNAISTTHLRYLLPIFFLSQSLIDTAAQDDSGMVIINMIPYSNSVISRITLVPPPFCASSTKPQAKTRMNGKRIINIPFRIPR